MRQTASLVTLVVLAACASSNTHVDASRPRQNMVYSGADMPTIFTEKEHAVAAAIPQPVTAVYPAMKKAYAALEVPLNVDDTKNHQVGNSDFFKSRQFAGKPMTAFLDCGSGITGPNAASYRISMSLLSTATDDGKGGTALKTTLTASARDIAGGGTADKLPCSSNGRLESMLNDRITANVGH